MTRGAPLAMIGLVLAAWIGARAMLWESPFAAPQGRFPAATTPVAAYDRGATRAAIAVAGENLPPLPRQHPGRRARSHGRLALLAGGLVAGMEPEYAFARQDLRRAALRTPLGAGGAREEGTGAAPSEAPPFLAPPPAPPAARQRAGRWSMDGWGFWRQGSDDAPIAQGRVPIYGASQIGAVLQYRIAPGHARDPRLYARAYRALVRRGESELALGGSVRPLPRVPVRLFGELRVTDGAFRTEARPAVLAVTQLAPQALPLGTRLEAYAQLGWVGGVDATAFADGQASLSRELALVAKATEDALHLSLGAGAWGGAQEDAQRFDIGPTMRLDLTLGDVPARVSLDWRERVAGEAGPGSGVAVTLSTRF
ncbi:hypothetical protein [Erythrobacter tepidarius]|uniref:hypothetical protein n=1 Tax=Erythrobacter tepidarius TaxID=60454 RepID=UPI000A3C5476|nr:hypothetical protein [Erythrobacter tepidarius]